MTEFTWDERKAKANLRKHGVTFEEAVTVFGDVLSLSVDDASEPDRTVLLGIPRMQRLILVVSAELDDLAIRIISARRATSHERRRYEEGP
jgi:uncharacterized DUF497 family protein